MTKTQDVTLFNEDGDYSVSVDIDGDLHSKTKLWNGTDEVSVTDNKLDVNASMTPIQYVLQTIFTDTDVDFNDDTWHTIFDISSAGKPEYLWMEFYDSNFDVRITMDGIVGFEMNNSEMGSFDLADLRLVGYVGGAPYRRSSDLFSWHFPTDISFKTNFKVEVRRRSGYYHGFDKGLLIWKKKV